MAWRNVCVRSGLIGQILQEPLCHWCDVLPVRPVGRQVKDSWGFRLTARYDVYAQLLNDFVQPGFKPQIVRDPTLPAAA